MKKNKGLTFFELRADDDGYGSSFFTGKVANLDRYFKTIDRLMAKEKQRRTLVCGMLWKNKYYPVVDIDSEEDLSRAEIYLENKKYDYCKIRSSTKDAKHYWLILNIRYSTFKLAKARASAIPGGDVDYTQHMDGCQCMVLRAEYGITGQDIIIERAAKGELGELIQAFATHWETQKKKLEWLLLSRMLSGSLRKGEDKHVISINGYKEGLPPEKLKTIKLGDTITYNTEMGGERTRGVVYKILHFIEGVNDIVFLTISESDDERHVVYGKHVSKHESESPVVLLTERNDELRELGILRSKEQ